MTGKYRYGQWQGGPDPLAPPYDVRAALDQVGDRVLSGGSLAQALRDLLRRGIPDGDQHRPGLDDLLSRARRLRQEAARRGRLDGAVTRSQALLDQALAAEREELGSRDGEEARFAEAQLDNLPRSTARAVAELADYDWASDEARELYQQILAGLRRDVLDQRFAGLKQALAGTDPQSRAAQQAIREMLSDLNALLAAHSRGEDTTDAFADFMRRHGDFFPENPQDVDELVDALARRAAAGERLMASLSPAQREELGALMQQALADAGLAAELAALTANLRALRPDLNWTGRGRVRGEEPLGYGEATGALSDLAELDDLIDALGQEQPGASLDDVDVETVERQLGRSAAGQVQALRQLERQLRDQGWVTRGTDGLSLSPKALRRLGHTALRRVFAQLDARGRGEHDLPDVGAAGEATGTWRDWQFGDEQPLDVVRTVSNAVRRSVVEHAPVATDRPPSITLAPEDFAVVETQRRAGAAVALCVDLSFSMVSQGRWGPMKQTALALGHLMATKYPQDALQIIGFGLYAQRLSQTELAAIEPDFVQGTNLHHALQLAGRHLIRHPDAEPVVLVVTDGEPTAHLEPVPGRPEHGLEPVFSWPPLQATIRATLAEVDGLTRFGATINVFMLGEEPGLRRFVDAVARRNGGRVFTPSAERLGQYVVSDYLRTRRGRR